MSKPIDLAGRIFGRLTVVGYSHSNSSGRFWNCRCECGNEKIVKSIYLLSENTKSCGCLRSGPTSLFYKHGHINRNTDNDGVVTISHSSTYNSWINMKSRCYDENNNNFYLYGARGVSISDDWLHSFDNFLRDMGERPDGMELDRINTNGNYEKGNCRWVTKKVNMRNRRNSRNLTFNGETKTIHAWAEDLGIDPEVIISRYKRGNSVERILRKDIAKPVEKRMITYNGETLSVADWARKTGIKYRTIIGRLERNLPLDQVFYNGYFGTWRK